MNGISVPVHLVELLEEIRDLESDAYREMGGETKVSFSDIMTWAVEDYVAAWVAEHGAPPRDPSARKKFVEQLAKDNLENLRHQLVQKPQQH